MTKNIFTFAAFAIYLIKVSAAPLSFEFSPTLNTGSDTHGIVGSTWVFTFEVTQPTYQLSGTFNDISFIADSAEVTISGVTTTTALNDTHVITTVGGDGTFRFIPNFVGGGTTVLALQGAGNTVSEFTIEGLTMSSFGPSVNPGIGSPIVGDPVDLEPYNAASYTGTFTFDGTSFDYVATGIPEPSSLALMGILAISGIVGYRSFQKRYS